MHICADTPFLVLCEFDCIPVGDPGTAACALADCNRHAHGGVLTDLPLPPLQTKHTTKDHAGARFFDCHGIPVLADITGGDMQAVLERCVCG